ncbi:hypothetical protein I7I48_04098 [Histoplasma ohiense]|nr:hypothetical protein I7I48_04098 [Histoplasma ohiense (nom. inval.)]
MGRLLGTFLPAAHHGFIGTMSNKNKIFMLKRAKIFCNCHLTEGLTTHSNQKPTTGRHSDLPSRASAMIDTSILPPHKIQALLLRCSKINARFLNSMPPISQQLPQCHEEPLLPS